jgi:hypothetical protein
MLAAPQAFHFEIMGKKPLEIIPAPSRPSRRFGTYALTCFTVSQLRERYHDPIKFLGAELRR